MTKSVIGIDPGVTGAISFYDGKELLVYDMPVFEITKGKTLRKRIDSRALRMIITDNLTGIYKPHVFIEQVSAQQGNGAAAAFTYGQGYGTICTVIELMELPHSYVLPQKWKKALNVPKDKDAARMRASQMMPQFSHNWDRKMDHNRAESALIAAYGLSLI